MYFSVFTFISEVKKQYTDDILKRNSEKRVQQSHSAAV